MKMIKNEEGIWLEDDISIGQLFQSFYENLFQSERGREGWCRTQQGWGVVNIEKLKMLGRDVKSDEIRRAFFQMGSFKAPGNYGFPVVFYQKNWGVLGSSVCHLLNEFWRNPERIEEVNDTLVVLIPKVEQPETVSQFRPISLCNVLYKGLAKVIVNRLKPLMDKLVSPYQTSFVPRRSIHDNIVVAKETVHSMKKMQGQKGYMILKVDLEKAYDRMEWSFLGNVLREIGVDEKLRKVIDKCMSTSSMTFLWNGGKHGSFVPSRGLRQGDPLSQYLFVLGMEKLTHLIVDSVNYKR